MFRTSEEAEGAFYAALEAANLDRMMDVWDDDDNIICVHPMGPRLEGRQTVAKSWQRIFGSGVEMRFRLSDAQRTRGEDLAIHVVHENITSADRQEESTVIATNVYRRTSEGWRMILHHASPAPVLEQPAPKVVH